MDVNKEKLVRWNVDVDNDCCSEQVRIVFLALKDAICWIGDAAFKWQARDITSHVIQTWLDLMNGMLREAIWTGDAYVPTINAYVSFALGSIVLPAIYFVGPKLTKEIIESSEYHYLFELMSTQGRLLNDIHSFKTLASPVDDPKKLLQLNYDGSGGFGICVSVVKFRSFHA